MPNQDDVIRRALIQMSMEYLQECKDAGMPIDLPNLDPEPEQKPSAFEEWLAYNVIMTGRVPLIDDDNHAS
jgi:hypothetical protein